MRNLNVGIYIGRNEYCLKGEDKPFYLIYFDISWYKNDVFYRKIIGI